MRRRFFLLFNPTAGTSRANAVARLMAALQARGSTIVKSTATSADSARAEATTAARSGDYDALVACGGDGTVRQVAIAAAGTNCPVGAVMLGTGNVLAHELALPRSPEHLAAMLCQGPTVTVRMALANDEPFLLMAGAGFDGRVIASLNQRLKQTVAKAAYVPATLQALLAPLDDLTITIDGHVHRGVRWAIITSASRYGGAFCLTERASLRRDGLVAILFYGRSNLDLMKHGLAIARGRIDHVWHHVDSNVFIRSCTTADIEAPKAVPLQVDGDAFGSTPLRVRSDGPRVSLIVPTHD